MDECVPTVTYQTKFNILRSDKPTRYFLNFSQNFIELFDFLESNPSSIVPNISRKDIVLNISDHFNYSLFWGGKGMKISLDLAFSDCVNSTFFMNIQINLPLFLQYNSIFIMKNTEAAITLSEYCPSVKGVPIKSVIEAAGSFQSATSPILNVVIIFSSTINIQGVSASVLLSLSKFMNYRPPESIQTAYDTEKSS